MQLDWTKAQDQRLRLTNMMVPGDIQEWVEGSRGLPFESYCRLAKTYIYIYMGTARRMVIKVPAKERRHLL